MQHNNFQLNFAVVEITNRCNLRCPHCASASGCAREDEMSLAEMRQVMHDLAALGCGTVTILGGEFLMRKDWYEIAESVRANGMQLQLVTNGLLVTDAVRERIKTLGPRAVGVSFDGATPETFKRTRGVDGFAKCRQFLDDLVTDGSCQATAITTFTSRNLADFDRFAEMFLDSPIVWQIQVAHKAGERFDDSLLLSEGQFEWYVEQVKKCQTDYGNRLKLGLMDDFGYFPLAPEFAFLHQTWKGCPAGRHVIGIRANGDVLPCLSLGSEFVEDNLRRRPLRTIWEDEFSFPRFRGKPGKLTGSCAKCPKAAECRAGCSAAALSTTGSLTENRFCVRKIEMKRILSEMLDV